MLQIRLIYFVSYNTCILSYLPWHDPYHIMPVISSYHTMHMISMFANVMITRYWVQHVSNIKPILFIRRRYNTRNTFLISLSSAGYWISMLGISIRGLMSKFFTVAPCIMWFFCEELFSFDQNLWNSVLVSCCCWLNLWILSLNKRNILMYATAFNYIS